MVDLIKALKIAFASEYSFFVKAQFFHWNVEGPDFHQYHTLFGDIYSEVYDTIDVFAENIRKVGGYTPGSFERLSMLTKIDDEITVPSALLMVQNLLADSDKLADLFGLVYELGEKYKQYGLCNYLAERQDAHRKHSWMLRATLK